MDNKVHEVDIDFDVDSDLPSEFSEDELNDEALAVHEADLLAYTDQELDSLDDRLHRDGLVRFLRWYLSPDPTTGRERSLRQLVLGFGWNLPAHLLRTDTSNSQVLPFARKMLVRLLKDRPRLPQYSTPEQAVKLLQRCNNIIVLTGAGISTACGIPDFRSRNGLYAQLEDQYELDDPQEMFDIRTFRERPEVFYHFAKQIYPKRFVPSVTHRFIKMLEDKGKLLRNYTQNIDTLETMAGVQKVLNCHGSFKTASCLRCRERVPGATIEDYIASQTVAYCKPCRVAHDAEKAAAHKRKKGKGKAKYVDDSEEDEDVWTGGPPGIIKPDITFFGEAVDSEFDHCLYQDREKVDLLLVIGTSLKVAPVSDLLIHIPHEVPQIYISLEPIGHLDPDMQLCGKADNVVSWLSAQCGWTIPEPPVCPLSPETPVAPRLPDKVEDLAWISGPAPDHAHTHTLLAKSEVAQIQFIEEMAKRMTPGFRPGCLPGREVAEVEELPADRRRDADDRPVKRQRAADD